MAGFYGSGLILIQAILLITDVVGWLLEFYVLATSKVISGEVQICDSAHLWQLYSAVLLRDHAARTMTWYST